LENTPPPPGGGYPPMSFGGKYEKGREKVGICKIKNEPKGKVKERKGKRENGK
jgi:hypothetical protein